MTEEINYSYEGGLYGELIRNRAFKANPTNAVFWKTVGAGKISLAAATPLNDALNVSLQLDAGAASNNSPAGFANGGYWGIPVKPKTKYHVSFFAKAAAGFTGPLAVSLESVDGKTVLAAEKISGLTGDWKKFDLDLKSRNLPATKDTVFKITTAAPGTIWFQNVSLFPPTYKDRVNGNRPDISKLLADMNPKFLRFPGGNYVEGDNFKERFDWKKTIGPVEQRAGHRSCWGYWSTDGFGLPEFLGWCQDLNMEPVLAVFAGYTLKHDHVSAGPELEPYVQEALEEIEYVTGDATTKWGAQRIKDGYPNPFPLHYVEIGNEDWFDRSGSYDGRFAQFYDAIKAKYPQLKIIATVGYEHAAADRVHSRTPDLVDEHYYKSEQEMEAQANVYDKRDRSNPTKIFVGEWATRVGAPTPNMAGALGDAAWMCGMERNADLVTMHCYAPLFVNVSDVNNSSRAVRSMQWPSDLIGYDALTSYGSPSYYVQKMFSTRHGDNILATAAQAVPSKIWWPPARRRNGVEQPRPPAQEIPEFFYDATRDGATGKIFVKLVNSQATEQSVKIEISGVNTIARKGKVTVLKADKLDDTNSIKEPAKITPKTTPVSGFGKNFTTTLPPFSVTVLELSAK
jgi:alpha-N-arabinofuranosidase